MFGLYKACNNVEHVLIEELSTKRFSIESRKKPKPKLSPQPIRRKENTLKSQGEVKVKPSKLPKARETRVTKLRLVLVLHLIG